MGRRKEIVGFAKAEGEPVLLSSAQLQLLADAYGRDLPKPVRTKIAFWTALFSLTMHGERHAPSLATLDSDLRKLHRVARSLRESVFGPREGDGMDVSLDAVVKFYEGRRPRRRTKDIPDLFIPLLQHALDAILVTSEFLQSNLNRHCPRTERGWSWEMLVGRIYSILKEHGFAVGARKDFEALDRISSFVSLIKALQKELPHECRRFTASDSALSQGISRALRKEIAPNDVLRGLPIPGSEIFRGDEQEWVAYLTGQMQRKKRRKKARA